MHYVLCTAALAYDSKGELQLELDFFGLRLGVAAGGRRAIFAFPEPAIQREGARA